MTAHSVELSGIALTVLAVMGFVSVLFLAVLVPLRVFRTIRGLVQRGFGSRRPSWRTAAGMDRIRQERELDGKRLGPRVGERDDWRKGLERKAARRHGCSPRMAGEDLRKGMEDR